MQNQPSTTQPLPFFEGEQAGRLRQPTAPAASPTDQASSLDRQETIWYRLFTAIASCYVYVVAHTAPEPCRFEIDPSGRARCLLSDDEQWEITLPEAAYRQFETIVLLWRDGLLGDSEQTNSMSPGAIARGPGDVLGVEILPAENSKRRTRTMAR